jgi:hypothetical protein
MHNKPKAVVHPGQYADGPQKKKKKKVTPWSSCIKLFYSVPENKVLIKSGWEREDLSK